MTEKIISGFNKYLEQLYLTWQIDPKLKEAINYSLLSGGKRLRPLLFFNVLNSFGENDFDRYFDIAAAIEMVHTYSLIHDDLPAMDNDKLRRGKPTNHVMFGEDLAILAGDALLTDAFNILAESKVNSKQKVDLVKILSQAAGSLNMVSGQVEDIKMSSGSKDKLIQMHYHKTAAMFVAASLFGAVCLDLNEDQSQNIKTIAENFGIAFQIEDDLHDLKHEQNDGNNFAANFGIKEAESVKNHLVHVALRTIEKLQSNKFNPAPLTNFLKLCE